MKEEKTKRKQKPKAGRVVRLTPDLVTIIGEEQREGETISDTVRRLLGLVGKVRFALPSDLFESIEDARGAAILRAVRGKSAKREKPVAVKAVK